MDYFLFVSPDQWTFEDSTPQCITLFIFNDNTFEGPIPETIRASFVQEGVEGTQETTICIFDDEPGNIIIIIMHAAIIIISC